MREKLIELLDGVLTTEDVTASEKVADHLIANGVRLERKQSIGNNASDNSVAYNLSPTEPLTNADRIRAMTDEELAKHFSTMICDINEGVEYHAAPKIWLEWLQQPAEGD